MIRKEEATPKPVLTVTDAVALIIGIVVGVGIFRTPSLVAENVPTDASFLFAWLLGGIISLIGALCYAELATTYPHAGGEYHFLFRFFGRHLAFLFAWARLAVIQTGSIAMLAFVFGDYMTELFPIGPFSSPFYAGLAVLLLTAVQILGVRQGKWTQNLLTAAKVIGLLLIIAFGFFKALPKTSSPQGGGAFGLAMIFVLLTYGGWNEAAYISAELKDVRRNMVKALMVSLGAIMVIYLLVNYAYLRGLGLGGVAKAGAVAADLMRELVGEGGAKFVSALIALSVLGAANATIFTGARTNYALGRDFRAFAFLGRWDERTGAPVPALLVQGIVTFALIALGAWTRRGFETMVEYTAPVFWFFFLLVGISLFLARFRDPDRPRPFRVPLYPLTPLLFCASSAFMLYASLAYTRIGALVGVAALLLGIPLLWLDRRRA